MNTRTFLHLAVYLAVALESAQAEPFANGSFEIPPLGVTNGGHHLITGDSAIAPWAVESPANTNIGWLNGNFNRPYAITAIDGTHQIEFNGGDAPPGGSIFQDFDTIPGHSYVVSFYIARLSIGAGTVAITATTSDANGMTLGSLVQQATTIGYSSRSTFTFVATTGITRLRFTDISTATNSVDLMLDGVSVVDSSAVLTADVQFYAGIRITGVVDANYRIEYTDDLTQQSGWTTLTAITLITSPQTVYDPTSPARRQRFYRVVPAQ